MAKAASKDHPYIGADEYVPALLSNLNNRIASGASQLYLKHFGVGINEWRILSVLSNTPHSNATHIGDTVSMHKTVVSRSVRDLESKGLLIIEKVPGQRTIVLTPEGQAMHDRLAEIALKRETLLMADFTEDEREQLLQLLRRMRGNLPRVDAWEPEQPPSKAVRRRPRAA